MDKIFSIIKGFKSKSVYILILFALFSFTDLIYALPVTGNGEYETFYQQSLRMQNAGMFTLGSWAVINIASGGYGWSVNSGERMYFDQMNLFWNVVNLSIASFALYGNYNTDISSLSNGAMIDDHLRTEKILMISTGFNLGYIGTGLLMRYLSERNEKRTDLIRGYGNSIVLQGSFLLVFDLVLYGFLRSHRIEFTENISLALSPGIQGVRLLINI